jgi:beta-barrel assembly-enhancing protease
VKRVFGFLTILLVALTCLYFAQRHPRHDVVSPNAIVDVAADWQHDLTRTPMHVTRIPDDEEVGVGENMAKQYEASESSFTPEEKALDVYVNQVGRRLAVQAKRKLPFRFHVVPNADLINAFGLPGGQVFIGKGLLDQLTSEDELAFILGHEIEHIDHYHAVERVQIEAQFNRLDLEEFAALAQLPVSLLQDGYSKDEEFEADREGLRLAVAAGYSAQGAVKLLERWTQLYREYVIHADTPTDELGDIAIAGLEGYFRTHPQPSERLAQARQVIADDHLPTDRPLTPFHLEYEVTAQDR